MWPSSSTSHTARGSSWTSKPAPGPGSVPEVETDGEALWQTGLPYRPLGGLPIVGNSPELEAPLGRVPDAIAGAGIMVAGLSDAAGIDQRRAGQRSRSQPIAVHDVASLDLEDAREVGVTMEAHTTQEQLEVGSCC